MDFALFEGLQNEGIGPIHLRLNALGGARGSLRWVRRDLNRALLEMDW